MKKVLIRRRVTRTKMAAYIVAMLGMFMSNALTAGAVNAATIAGWSFTGVGGGANNFGPSPLPATTVDPNVLVVGWTRGPGVGTTGTGANNAWGGNAWDGSTSAAQAVANGDFAFFTVSADPGYVLSLSTIDPYNVRRSGTGPTTGQWQYSLDGTNFSNVGSAITWGSNTSASGNPQAAIDLTGISDLQNVSSATSVTFRIANYNASGSAGTWYLNGGGSPTTLVIHGTATAIPEPSTVALTLLGLASASQITRRRRWWIGPIGRNR